MDNRSRFDASDLAWFAAGMHKDGNHYHSPQCFHPLAETLQKETKETPQSRTERKELLQRVQELTFDMATLWDRASGGTTMVLHCTGTTVPGAPLQPEYLKAHVYLPPAFVTQNQQLHEPIMNLVQQFTETIGLKTTIDWPTRAHKSFGYNLTQTGVVHANSSMDLFPTPEANTSYYVFLGQPASPFSSDASPFSSDASPFSSDAASPASSYDIRNELGPETYEILNLREIIRILRAEKSSLAEELDIVRSTVSHLEHQMLYYSSAAASSMDKTPSRRLKPTAVSHLTPTRDPTRDYR
ncbi:hypothetical protein CVT25_006085 [Psilocybe cyanescens]|uniref:Uncharacterized protein n=1 Tax=Psilocybe cyanescens TaxID=93625 RepID=A0A409X9Y8_PSICY|nr:hypothetical protein CVT25_006085 [Psilocybe cyanescens]